MPSDGLNDCQVVTKKASWAPGPCANFQEITMESMPVLPLEESCPNTLTTAYYPLLLGRTGFDLGFGLIVARTLSSYLKTNYKSLPLNGTL